MTDILPQARTAGPSAKDRTGPPAKDRTEPPAKDRARPAPAEREQRTREPERTRRTGRTTTTTTGTRRRLGPGKAIPFARLAGPVLVVLIWWAAAASGYLDPRILSGPGTVASTAVDLIRSGRLQSNVAVSLQRAGLGLLFGVLAGVLLAVAAGLSRTGEYLLDGTLQVKRAIPSLALLPLMILWLGIGEEMKVTLIALGVAVVVYINTYASLTGIDRRYVELGESLDLTRLQFIRKVVVPGALPGFFVGLRLAVTASWLGLVVVEQVNATKGLGYMMFQAQLYAQSDVIIVGLVVYGIFGFVSDALVRAAERRVLSWRRTLAD
ncbi:ABC transporter permease [Streptomyces sp. NBC_01198]|uniref:ABC transporter permease n=1 Tax=Streptomyces sp. NBC_01198 TaxID=2903769 RepID=UPI002E11747D|nr:ABC transporter permease [Streptomyces sp. NBC_01198]